MVEKLARLFKFPNTFSGDVADQASGTSAGETPAGPAQFGRPAMSLGGLIGAPPTGASPRERPPRGAFLIPRPLGVVDYSPQPLAARRYFGQRSRLVLSRNTWRGLLRN